jgi:hypothetical protein
LIDPVAYLSGADNPVAQRSHVTVAAVPAVILLQVLASYALSTHAASTSAPTKHTFDVFGSTTASVYFPSENLPSAHEEQSLPLPINIK